MSAVGVALSPSFDLQCGLTPGEPLVSQTLSDCSSETGEPRHPVAVGPVSEPGSEQSELLRSPLCEGALVPWVSRGPGRRHSLLWSPWACYEPWS